MAQGIVGGDAVGDRDSTSSGTSSQDHLTSRPSRVKRIMERDLAFHQSWGRLNIKKIGRSNVLLFHNAFHVILQMSTWKLIALCLTIYTLAWVAYARWWMAIAVPCSISVDTYLEALYLSIETMMTIGYGVDDPFFGECVEALPLLICQSFSGLLLDIAIVGVIFQRFSRAYKRAATVLFSDTLLLRVRNNNKVQLAFRVAEMQDAPLLQVTLQAYCVIHRNDLLQTEEERPPFETGHSSSTISGGHSSSSVSQTEDIEEVVIKPLKLQQLDANNNVLLCGLPMTVIHNIDRHSPLAPCNRFQQTGTTDPDAEDVYENLRTLPYVEVIVILSGVEEITGASVEGRQSYTIDEMRRNQEFARCVSLNEDGSHRVDFTKFHDTTKLVSLSDSSGRL